MKNKVFIVTILAIAFFVNAASVFAQNTDKKESEINLYVNDAIVGEKAEDWELTIYKEKNYAEKKKPLDFSNKVAGKPILTENALYGMLYEVLIDEGLVDTTNTNTLFIDKNKIGFLNITVDRFRYEIIAKTASHSYVDEPNLMAITTIKWELLDIYQQKKFEKKIKVKSKKFHLADIRMYLDDANEDLYDALQNSIKKSLKKFLASKEVKDLTENHKLVEGAPIDTPLSISKPTNAISGLGDAKASTVTVKVGDDGHGSGFFINNDGYIITNYHVIVDADENLTVITDDGEELDAEVVRVDALNDIAIIKVDNKNKFSLIIPKAETFSIGDEVYAIGTPKSIELGQTLSKGIVSGSRKHNDVNIIQSDVSVNPGNSGGPLVNKKGELIGVVRSKLIGFGVEGISFMIPASKVSEFLGIEFK